MQKIFSVLVATILFASCAQDANGLEAIHVEGNRFVDESGNTIVFKGLCLADPVKLFSINR